MWAQRVSLGAKACDTPEPFVQRGQQLLLQPLEPHPVRERRAQRIRLVDRRFVGKARGFRLHSVALRLRTLQCESRIELREVCTAAFVASGRRRFARIGSVVVLVERGRAAHR